MCYKAIRVYVKEAKVGIQLVEPHDHIEIPAERAIQTFKNHFLADCALDTVTFQSHYGAS